MVYCFCNQCGCYFPKGHAKKPTCINCGSRSLHFKKLTEKEMPPVMREVAKSMKKFN